MCFPCLQKQNAKKNDGAANSGLLFLFFPPLSLLSLLLFYIYIYIYIYIFVFRNRMQKRMKVLLIAVAAPILAHIYVHKKIVGLF